MFAKVYKMRGLCTMLKSVKRRASKSCHILNDERLTAPTLQFAALPKIQPWKNDSYRTQSTLSTHVYPQTANMATPEEKEEFLAVFPQVMEDLRSYNSSTELSDATERYIQMLENNLPFGRLTTGLMFITMYKMIQNPEYLTPKDIRVANILGWCTEMCKNVWGITDDVVDAATTRHGRTCWYQRKGIGRGAINDAQLLENGMYYIFRKYLSGRRCYAPAMEVFHYTNLKSSISQSMDTMFMADGKPQLKMYSMDNYITLSENKACYPFLYYPAALALCYADLYDQDVHDQVEIVTRKLAGLFQTQDDVSDCFGSRVVDGDFGRDIQEGRCTWLIAKALQMATPAQRQILEQNYGRAKPECVAAVRNLYTELDLLNVYLKYWEESYHRLRTYIQQTSKKLPPQPLFHALDVIYGRKR